MPNKISDNDIKKALEDWIKNYDGSYVNFKTLGNALELINRLEAENERLETEKDNLIKTYSECQVANLQNFMQGVENKLANNIDISMLGYQSVICDMEETYKEMVGDK